MNSTSVPPNTISELADRVERIREELLSIQRSLEKMEPVEAAVESAPQAPQRETPRER